MGIVGFALRFRHTFYVLAVMMLFLGGSAIDVSIPRMVNATISSTSVIPRSRALRTTG